jgi:hypothetical protein
VKAAILSHLKLGGIACVYFRGFIVENNLKVESIKSNLEEEDEDDTEE